MNQQSMRMQNLIGDLLMLSSLEGKDQIAHTHVPLRPLLAQIMIDAKTLSAGKHLIQMDCEDLDVTGNAIELSSAFSNVIFNAVKYTPVNGDIYIHCYKGDKSLQLAVKDTGIGIDSIHLSRLTERFYRADPSRHSDTGGTGLGLAIVKHILLRHDGHIEIQSKLGKGSTFICHLPLNRVI
jgi:two-component system phosphate regulon sensor histidine kinase PhoR